MKLIMIHKAIHRDCWTLESQQTHEIAAVQHLLGGNLSFSNLPGAMENFTMLAKAHGWEVEFRE